MWRNKLRTTSLLLGALVAMVWTDAAQGIDQWWIDPGDGFFSDSANWSGGAVPGANDYAVFDTGSVHTVYFVSSPTNQRLRVLDDDVQFALGTRTYTLTSTTTPSITIGDDVLFNNSHLRLVSGTLASVSANVGNGRRGGGTMTVSNTGVWQNSQLLNIGLTGPGTVDVLNGGRVTSAFATIGLEQVGHATVSGAGSVFTTTAHLDVAGNDIGTLDIQSTGRVSTTTAAIGGAPAASGTVTINGPNSRWDQTDAFRVGEYGTAVLSLSNGAFVTNSSLSADSMIADQYNSNGTATVASNSRWSVQHGDLLIGHLGNGTLYINSAGGVTVGGYAHIAHGGGTGQATVTGAGSFLSAQQFYIGGNNASSGGTGSLTVADGGQVQASNGGQVKLWGPGTVHLHAGGRISTGRLTLAGGALDWTGGQLWLNDQELQIGPAGLFGPSLTVGATRELSVSPGINVGVGGNGAMTVNGGGRVLSTSGIVGYDANRTGTVTLDGAGTEWYILYPCTVGLSGTGEVTLTNGAMLTSFGDSTTACGMIGDGVVARGSVTVDGVGSHWQASGSPSSPSEFNVGYDGIGTVTVRNGGTLTNQGAPAQVGYLAAGRGNVDVQGDGSRWTVDTYALSIGYFGEGALQVTSGGVVDNALSLTTVGEYGTSTGTVVVDGAGAQLLSAALTIANYGEGQLTIRNGGQVEAGITSIAQGMGSTGDVVIEGIGARLSNLTSLGYLIVGSGSEGTMTIRDGGVSESLEVFIGDGMPAVGRLEVTGAGSQLIAEGEIDVGFFGNGTLEIRHGGVAATQFGSVGYGSMSTGLAVVEGSGAAWNMTDRLEIGGGSSGRLTIGTGGVVRATNNVSIHDTGTLDLNGGRVECNLVDITAGAMVGIGIIDGDVLNDGSVMPGHPFGTMTVDGIYAQTADATLMMELSGTEGGSQYDQLIVMEAAVLDGGLEVRFVDSYVPPQNAVFQIVTSGGRTGTFAQVNLVDVPSGVMMDVEYTPTSVLLRVVSSPETCTTCRGDMNGDHRRDGEDISLMVGCAIANAPSVTCPCGEFVQDGLIDTQDVAALCAALVNSYDAQCP